MDTVKMDGKFMVRNCNGIHHSSPFSVSTEEHSKATCNGGSLGMGVRDGVFMTYKRRKCMGNGTSTQRIQESPVSERIVSKATNRCAVQLTDANHGLARDTPALLDYNYASLQQNWRKALEQMLSSSVSKGGIEGCIRTALTSGIFPVTQQFQRQPFSNQTSYAKDAEISGQDHFNGERENHCQVPRETEKSRNANSVTRRNGSRSKLKKQVNGNGSGMNTEHCQNVFGDVITSEKFAALCNLLICDLQDFAFSAFHVIDMNMKDGVYEMSPQSFASDMQQVWEKFRKKGQQMISLTDSLSDISLVSYKKQVGNLPQEVHGDQKHKINRHCSGQLVQRTKPEGEAYLSCKDCICRQCGSGADGDNSLICDCCEEMYHFSCIEPPLVEIPNKSWYCGICSSNGKLSPQHNSLDNGAEDPSYDGNGKNAHSGCAVCKRLHELQIQGSELENSRMNGIAMLHYRSEGSDFHTNTETDVGEISMEEESQNLGLSCKVCRTGVDDEREFVKCANSHCLSRYYHINCLKSPPRVISPGWYCPSCLCRSCLVDRDDDLIVLCDDCDGGYHTFCMEPPQSTIPKGKWYCNSCEKKRNSSGVKNKDKFRSSRSISEEKSSGRRKNR